MLTRRRHALVLLTGARVRLIVIFERVGEHGRLEQRLRGTRPKLLELLPTGDDRGRRELSVDLLLGEMELLNGAHLAPERADLRFGANELLLHGAVFVFESLLFLQEKRRSS